MPSTGRLRRAVTSPVRALGGGGNDADPQRAMHLLRRERTRNCSRRWSCAELLLIACGYAGLEAATLDIIAEVQQRLPAQTASAGIPEDSGNARSRLRSGGSAVRAPAPRYRREAARSASVRLLPKVRTATTSTNRRHHHATLTTLVRTVIRRSRYPAWSAHDSSRGAYNDADQARQWCLQSYVIAGPWCAGTRQF